ncbi:MAG TPA: hypothetical protein VFB39_02190 [Solirubrobacteraceae bacterium]|nr:hypothetical protein [Solirubrobacteraceae bacterium]
MHSDERQPDDRGRTARAVSLAAEIIGGLIGSRRPTVTLALQKLASDGVLERLQDNRWKLARTIVSV